MLRPGSNSHCLRRGRWPVFSIQRSYSEWGVALLNGMRRVFSQQRTLYITILAARPPQRGRQADSLLAEHLVPVQKQILDWSGKLQVWNGERLQRSDRALATQFAQDRKSVA